MLNYEKKYKELVGKIDKAYLYVQTDSAKAVLEEIRPELKESEDEIIRKDLITFLDDVWHLGKDANFDKWGKADCSNWIAWLEKQGEQKPADKVEPKFHEGEWVVYNDNGCICQIKSIREDDYCLWPLDSDIEGYLKITDIDNKYHLWSIQDVKDGDVLVDEDNNIGIYKEIEGLYWDSYIYLGCDGKLRGFSIGGSHKQVNTRPATKKQRDLLFQKMKEAGYEWDAEKKELKKIEEKHAWSEEDESNLDSAIYYIRREPYRESDVEPIVDWLRHLKEKVQPQPKQEWSEEDKKMSRFIGNAITADDSSMYLESKGIQVIDAHAWLDELKERYT